MKRRATRSWAAAGLVAGVLALPTAAVAAQAPATVRLSDPRITEASALVDLGSSWVTSNDSGDSARLFTLSPTTGRTVGVTHFNADVVDVEALAPARGGAVWVGDIGDNDRSRASVSVYRVPVGPGRIDVTARRYRLVYPHGRPNAESLFLDRQGRMYVITKSIGGGVVYRAPLRLSSARSNRLEPVARVVEFATDAALTRDGRHVIVRGPEIAGVYTVPRFQRVGSFRLPLQPQGEGISVGPDGRVRVSSEGAHSSVRQVTVPAALQRVIDPTSVPAPSAAPSAPSATPSASASPSASTGPTASESAGPSASATPPAAAESAASSTGGIGSIDPPWLMWCIPAVIAVGALGIGLGLRRRTE